MTISLDTIISHQVHMKLPPDGSSTLPRIKPSSTSCKNFISALDNSYLIPDIATKHIVLRSGKHIAITPSFSLVDFCPFCGERVNLTVEKWED